MAIDSVNLPEYTCRMDIQDIIRAADPPLPSRAKLADLLTIRRQSLYGWQRVPPDWVLTVEAITGISRHELRPDLYPRED